MKPQDIKVGKTYRNKGKGTTLRKVIAIGDEHRPKIWYGMGSPDVCPGVLYKDVFEGTREAKTPRNLYLSSFASWAGKEVG